MDVKEFFIYLIIMAGSTYLIRVIPFIAIREKITNKFVNSFLYYIPYTVLVTMTFPAALYVTGHIISAILGLICSCFVSLKGKNLTIVALLSSGVVFLCEILIMLFS